MCQKTLLLVTLCKLLKDRTQPIYDEVAKIKPILVSKSQTIPQTRTGSMGEVIDIPSKKVAAQKTRSGQQILTDIENKEQQHLNHIGMLIIKQIRTMKLLIMNKLKSL